MGEQPAYPAPVEQPPVCPRHPDRESYVRCQRCHRPACPQCQRPAAVGIQCVDCVAEGARTVRQGTTVFGGTVTDGRPVVTFGIIAICVAVFLAQLVIPGLTEQVAFVPALGASEPWRFITSAFAHSEGQIMHIGFNMYALWMMWQYLEPLLGRGRFVATYLISAFGGSVFFLLMSSPPTLAELAVGRGGNWWTGAVGASGAVFGLFAAFIVLQRRLGRSATSMVVVIAINAAIGFIVPGIAWQAHLGGLVTGAACAAAIAYLGRRPTLLDPKPSYAGQWVGLGGILVILVGLAVVKYALVG